MKNLEKKVTGYKKYFMWPFRRKRNSEVNVNKLRKAKNFKYKGHSDFETAWLGGPKINIQLKEEADLILNLLVHKPLLKRNPRLEGSALVFKLYHKEYICEVVVEIRPIEGTTGIFGGEINKDGLIIVYFQNISDEPMVFHLIPEFILTGGLVQPWKAGNTTMFFPHMNAFNEILTWQSTFDDNNDIKLYSTEIETIINRCEAILEQVAQMMIENL